MQKLLSFLKFDIKTQLRPGLAIVLLAPALIAISVYMSLPEELFTRGTIEPFSIAANDNGGDMVTHLIVSTLSDFDIIDEVRIVTREKGLSLLEQGNVAVFVDIPIDLEMSLIHNNPATISVYGGRDFPLQSTVMRAAAVTATDGVSAVQSAIYVFNELAFTSFEEPAEFFDTRARLAMDLMWLSLGRTRAVDVTEPASTGYLAHLIAIIIFISAGVAAVYVSINTAEQHRSRSTASMRMAGLGFTAFATNKCAQTIMFSIIAIAPTMLLATIAGLGGFSPLRLALGTIALAILFSLPCLLFSLTFRNPAQTALCGFGFLFCTLFIGGAFPAHLTGDIFAAIAQFSPSATASNFTAWASGGTLTATTALPLLISAGFILPAWRKFRFLK
jgi:hypothetical protein